MVRIPKLEHGIHICRSAQRENSIPNTKRKRLPLCRSVTPSRAAAAAATQPPPKSTAAAAAAASRSAAAQTAPPEAAAARIDALSRSVDQVNAGLRDLRGETAALAARLAEQKKGADAGDVAALARDMHALASNLAAMERQQVRS